MLVLSKVEGQPYDWAWEPGLLVNCVWEFGLLDHCAWEHDLLEKWWRKALDWVQKINQ